MGAFGKHCYSEQSETKIKYIKINPNTEKFEILKTYQIGIYLIAMLEYPNCTNYKGLKVLVFDGETPTSLKRKTKIDPHFYEESNVIARFKPDAFGWESATILCIELIKKELK